MLLLTYSADVVLFSYGYGPFSKMFTGSALVNFALISRTCADTLDSTVIPLMKCFTWTAMSSLDIVTAHGAATFVC